MPISTLAQLIALVESEGNQYAIRFEPLYSPRISCVSTMAQICKCTIATAKVLCSMSWGYYQIMGDNLITLGLNITPFEYLESSAIQSEFFDAYCEQDHLRMTLDDVLNDASERQVFARLYNGPGDVPAYVQRIIDVARQNGLTVK